MCSSDLDVKMFCRDMMGACDYAICHPFPNVEIAFPTTVADGEGPIVSSPGWERRFEEDRNDDGNLRFQERRELIDGSVHAADRGQFRMIFRGVSDKLIEADRRFGVSGAERPLDRVLIRRMTQIAEDGGKRGRTIVE